VLIKYEEEPVPDLRLQTESVLRARTLACPKDMEVRAAIVLLDDNTGVVRAKENTRNCN
jgi:hypothetical protein